MNLFGRKTTIGLALVLVTSLGALEYAHIQHHLAEAEAHASGDRSHHHDAHACAVFHEGLLTEALFTFSEPVVPVVSIPADVARIRSSEYSPSLPSPRAPPVAS